MIWALHGNLGHPRDWQGLKAALGDVPIEAPCLWEPAPQPFAQWVKRFHAVVAERDPAPILLGYSLGGRLAMHAMTAAPNPWKAAIFVSVHPGLLDPEARASRQKVDRDWANRLLAGSVEDFLERWNAQGPLDGEPVASGQGAVVEAFRGAIAAGFEVWSLGVQADLRGALEASAVPQLWVAGADDAKFSSLMREAAARIPAATYAGVEGSGHRVPLRNPSGLAECLRLFLDNHNLTSIA